MSPRDPNVLLQDMLHATETAIKAAAGRKRSELESDLTLKPALERYFEIIGEAASKVPKEVRERFSAAAWQEAIGLRNRFGSRLLDHRQRCAVGHRSE